MDHGNFLKAFKLQLNKQELNDQLHDVFDKNLQLFDNHLKTMINNDHDRQNLLELVHCRKSIDFKHVFDMNEFNEKRFKHIATGSFGNAILMHCGRRFTDKIIKKIYCLPNELSINIRSLAMNYSDVYKETICMKILSKLSKGVRLIENQSIIESDNEFGDHLIYQRAKINNNQNDEEPIIDTRRPRKFYLFKTKCFPFLYEIYLCHNEFGSMINFNSIMNNSSMNDEINHLPMNHNFETIFIKMENCGQQLRELMNEKQIKPFSLISIFKQIVIGLAIAECIFYFEHRDLHMDNIICKKVNEKYVKFIFKSRKYRLLSLNFEAKIIDFGYSRISWKNEIYYKNLDGFTFNTYDANDDGDPYLEMNKLFQSSTYNSAIDWSNYSNQTNLIWLKYLLAQLLKSIDICYDLDQDRQELKRTKQYFNSIKKTIKNDDIKDVFELFNRLIQDDLNNLIPFRCY